MIDEDRTMQMFGYTSSDLSTHSGKKVAIVCEECGAYRLAPFNQIRVLCRICSDALRRGIPRSEDVKQRISETLMGHTVSEESRQKMSDKVNAYYSNPDNHEKRRVSAIETWRTPRHRETMVAAMLQYNHDHPEKGIQHSLFMTDRFVSDDVRTKHSENQIKVLSDPKTRAKMSASATARMKDVRERARISSTLRGIPYEEWAGFSNKNWRDWSKAVYLNKWFIGCERHHLTQTIVACIPTELHKHIAHNLSNGYNMGEMNMLALQFINGGYNG